MDFKKLIPDFNAIGKTDWTKPMVNFKEPVSLVSFVGAVLMVILVFVPWISLEAAHSGYVCSGSTLGIGTWYGVFAFIMALLAVAGVLYNHISVTFCAAVLGFVFGVIGISSFPEVEVVTTSPFGLSQAHVVKNAAEWDAATLGIAMSSYSRVGVLLYILSTIITAVVSFIKISKK